MVALPLHVAWMIALMNGMHSLPKNGSLNPPILALCSAWAMGTRSGRAAKSVEHIRQAALRLLVTWSSGAFGKFLRDTTAASVAAASPGATLARLARSKAVYDPEYVSSQTLNITPAVSAQA
jgi:hypothetical protein